MSNKTIDPRLTLRVGDIANQPDCDAIVNSANSNLRLGSGVSGAIHTAAGPDLEAYCVPLRPLGLGQVIATPGFNLPNPSIIHVRAPHYSNDANPEDAMAQAMRAVLNTAEAYRLRKIAIPALGTGKFVFPPEVTARIMVDTILGHLPRSLMTEVRIVLASEHMHAVFQAALDTRTQTP